MADPLMEGLTDEQRTAVNADEGAWLVAAGAGSGKTRVIERRFVRLVSEGKAEVSQVLTITFTRKAAAEMGRRIRERLRDQGLIDAMRQLDRAEINTIHGFCSGIVRRHALALGLDPRFGVVEEEQADILQRDAFERARDRLVRQRGEVAVGVLASYDAGCQGTLFKTISGLYGSLRSHGEASPALTVPDIDFAPARADLRQAIEEALEVIRDRGGNPSQAIRQMDALLEAMVEEDPDRAIEALAGKVREDKNYKDAMIAVNESRERLRARYMSVRAVPTLEFMGDLLAAFGEEYDAAKRAHGVLDFSDLELRTLELLRQRPDIEAAIAGDFRFTMVDEFQDTNPLQFDIIRRIAPKNLFVVGDANQSIYRFRHAEVELFRRIQRETDEKFCAPLKANFRSQPEIIDFIVGLFSEPGMLEPGCDVRLDARTDEQAPEMPFRVEALLVDADSRSKEKANRPLARAAEAELIARRLHDLFFESRKYSPGEAALLVRSGKDIDIYSQALDRYGIPNYLSIGRDFYEQLEFGDTLSMLRLISNPMDDLALVSVLRSPMVGAADDTLLQLRLMAGRDDENDERPLWPALSREANRQRFAEPERGKLQRFVEDLVAMRQRARQHPLADTVREAITYNDYCAVVAAGVNGKQAYANLMKLRDKAAAYEAAHGRDLQGLVEFLSELKLEEARETQAPVEEEEGGGAVRIMTIHGAKGLEFGVVVWANMSWEPPKDKPYILSDGKGRAGLRYRELGLDESIETFDFDVLAREDDDRELQEGKRVGYVAMTRARKHLILCGSADIDSEPGGFGSGQPVEWVRSWLGLDVKNPAVAAMLNGGPVSEAAAVLKGGVTTVGLTLCTDPQALVDAAGERAAAVFEGELPPCNPAVTDMPEPSRFQPAVVAATDIDAYQGCPYRYYLERVLGVGGLAAGSRLHGRPGAEPDRLLDGTAMGILVHAVLEHFPVLSSPELSQVEDGYLTEQAARALGPVVPMGAGDFEAARSLLGIFAGLETGGTVMRADADGRLRREVDFTTLVGETILRGKIDALVELDEGSLVVDYKTGSPDPGEAKDDAGKYRFQMAAYALAVARMRPGPVRVVLMFLGGGGDERVLEYAPDQAGDLERELAEAIDRFAGGFAPLEELDRWQCGICSAGPGGARLCPTAGQ